MYSVNMKNVRYPDMTSMRELNLNEKYIFNFQQ